MRNTRAVLVLPLRPMVFEDPMNSVALVKIASPRCVDRLHLNCDIDSTLYIYTGDKDQNGRKESNMPYLNVK